ncbi:MAG: disulfide bond formation protein B [Pseudomonadota bacterium]|jgi:disulfide bond formation protein DsbB
MQQLRAFHVHLAMAAASLALVAYAAYYLQAGLDLLPCPLCVMQRIAYLLVGFTALAAAVHRPNGAGRRVYGALMVLAALAGAGIAAWQVVLTYRPELASCAISPEERFLNALPLAAWWPGMFEANGDCTKVDWTFLGLSVPELSLIAFLLLAAAAVIAARCPR